MLAKNPEPKFVAPKHHKKRPHILVKCGNYASAKDKELHLWEGWTLIHHQQGRQRGFYEDARNNMRCMVPAMIHHLNIHTFQVQASIEELADLCGLSTESAAGNESICRASRFIQMLADAHIIECDKVWDKHNECWIPKFITVNPIFFDWIGIQYSEIEAAQAKLRRYVNLDYITAEELGTLSLAEIRKKAKIAHIRHAFRHRKEAMSRRKKARDHKKAQAKTDAKEKNDIAKVILSELTKEEIASLTPDELKLLVNQRRKYLRKIAQDVDPPPD